MARFTIREVRGLGDLLKVQVLQQEVWGFVPIDVVPLRLMRVMEKNGSSVLGAFAANGDLVGFAFGYLGVRDGRALFCSHMLGIDRRHRDKGVGFALKQAQREWCLRHGYDRMVWTFDPLESRNARFNLHKIGCFSDDYWVNLYGSVGSGLHAGSATDRFLVQWVFDAPSPDLTAVRAPVINPPRKTRAGLPDCEDPGPHADRRVVRVIIPWETQTVKDADLGLVRRWRLVTRGVFRDLFAAGYRVVDYDLPPSPQLKAYGSYVVQRNA